MRAQSTGNTILMGLGVTEKALIQIYHINDIMV